MYGNVIQGQIMEKIVKLRSKSTAEIEKRHFCNTQLFKICITLNSHFNRMQKKRQYVTLFFH